jgi:DNA-binding MarR family transcriptional regulator
VAESRSRQRRAVTAAAPNAVSEDALDAVLAASRSLVAVTEQSLGGVAEETTLAQYRALVVLASRGPQRMVDLAKALGVTPSTAGRMSDRLLRKGLIRRHRARADRREVQVSLTAEGREVVDEATGRRRALLAAILGRMTARDQSAVAAALRAFADAAGEVPDSQWPDRPSTDAGSPAGGDPAPAGGDPATTRRAPASAAAGKRW